jgi:hypothetical protein
MSLVSAVGWQLHDNEEANNGATRSCRLLRERHRPAGGKLMSWIALTDGQIQQPRMT